MLLTNFNSAPVSTGCFIANCLLATTILTPVSTCSYVHPKVKEKALNNDQSEVNVQRKIQSSCERIYKVQRQRS